MVAVRSKGRAASVVVDRTHLHRRASGIERVTEELFSDEALAPLHVTGIEARGRTRGSLLLDQTLRLPLRAMRAGPAVWVFPGYPPSPWFGLLRERVVFYVHDLFLLTRRRDLNVAGRAYMAPLFRLAVGRLRYFFVNSETTAANLAPYVRRDAIILPFRPPARNVFGLRPKDKPGDPRAPLIVGCIGTVEPRKNYRAAARIRHEMERIAGRPVELHIVGRNGWGSDHDALSRMPGVRLHGFLDDAAARAVIEGFDALLSTSHDEGLGLPLIELQYRGIPIVAPDQAVFREVLGESGTYIDPAGASSAAAEILSVVEAGNGAAVAERSGRNLRRWNALAEQDRRRAISFLADLAGASPDAGR